MVSTWAAWASWTGCTGPVPPAEDVLPADTLEALADELRVSAGSPGALLAVQRGDGARWIGAAGTEDLDGTVPMPPDAIFRAGSITKLFTGALVLREAESGRLALDAPLANQVPDFPNAATTTLDQLLSHTGGVTPTWFDGPELQAELVADLTRAWTIDEVVARMAAFPAGTPGPMVYSNTDFVLLGAVLEAATGTPYADLLDAELLGALPDTTYTFDGPSVHGYTEYEGLTLDATALPQTSFLSFAGPAGAVHTTTADLLTWADALFRGDVLAPSSRAVMTTPAEPGSWYGRAAMRFCPCAPEETGWGHGGHLPGFWAVVVWYPDVDVIVAAAVNRDVVDGVPLDVTVFDPTLAAVLDVLL